ncbi:MAG: glutaredoxin domain-containing protein [Bacteroidales bacterium]
MIVKVYSTQTCPYCQTLKEYLTSKGIEFESFDVGNDDTAREEMLAKANTMTVPVTDIDGKILVGFDLKELNAALGI